MCAHHPGLIKGGGRSRKSLVGLCNSLSQRVEKVDFNNLLHIARDYRNHSMVLIDKFLPIFSLLGDNVLPGGVI